MELAKKMVNEEEKIIISSSLLYHLHHILSLPLTLNIPSLTFLPFLSSPPLKPVVLNLNSLLFLYTIFSLSLLLLSWVWLLFPPGGGGKFLRFLFARRRLVLQLGLVGFERKRYRFRLVSFCFLFDLMGSSCMDVLNF